MNRFKKRRAAAWLVRLSGVGLDGVVMALAYLSAFLLRFDFHEPQWGWRRVVWSFVMVWLVQCLALVAWGCYRLLWRYMTVGDVPRFVGAIGSSTVVLLLLRRLLPGLGHAAFRPPYSISFMNSFLVLGGLLGVRLLWRLVVDGNRTWEGLGRENRRVLLLGAGSMGSRVAQELRFGGLGQRLVVGFLDDDVGKVGARVQGVAVLGQVDELPRIARKLLVDEVVVTMGQVPRETMQRIVRLARVARVALQIVPGYQEILEQGGRAKIRRVDVSDLLGRSEAEVDSTAVVEMLRGQRVMVTGAGGSIGSELVRQVLRAGPARLVMVERSEQALYEIEREVAQGHGGVEIRGGLADIGDKERMRAVFAAERPQIVIHAAAHKHVPLMETNAVEAIKNNVLATKRLGELALEHGVARFLFISTDKAVNPVSVMGLTKRLAEVVLQDLNRKERTCFAAVRFGNVLGSSGSVVPLFQGQIERGEAVTVTHPEMERYFMTIAEAVALVLQATALAQGGEIFVLDMGRPVKILELAEEMITLAGLRPHEDVPIVFSGVRPGEKLFEVLDVSEESAYRTGHARIFVSKVGQVAPEQVVELVAECERLAVQGEVEREEALARIVPLLR